MQNERKYPQNERKYPQTSANLKNVTMPAFLWMEEKDLVERFSGGERFFRGRAEIGNSSVFFSYLKKRARWVPQEVMKRSLSTHGTVCSPMFHPSLEKPPFRQSERRLSDVDP